VNCPFHPQRTMVFRNPYRASPKRHLTVSSPRGIRPSPSRSSDSFRLRHGFHKAFRTGTHPAGVFDPPTVYSACRSFSPCPFSPYTPANVFRPDPAFSFPPVHPPAHHLTQQCLSVFHPSLARPLFTVPSCLRPCLIL